MRAWVWWQWWFGTCSGGCLRTLIFAMQRQPQFVFRVYVFVFVCKQISSTSSHETHVKRRNAHSNSVRTATHSHNTFMHDKSHVILNFAPDCRAELTSNGSSSSLRHRHHHHSPHGPMLVCRRVCRMRVHIMFMRALARAWKKEHVHMLRYTRQRCTNNTRLNGKIAECWWSAQFAFAAHTVCCCLLGCLVLFGCWRTVACGWLHFDSTNANFQMRKSLGALRACELWRNGDLIWIDWWRKRKERNNGFKTVPTAYFICASVTWFKRRCAPHPLCP